MLLCERGHAWLIDDILFSLFPAEFRGPGVHHNFDDSDSGYDNTELEQRSRSLGLAGYQGRVIFLGDGTEVHTNPSDDADMVDQTEEDKDLVSQVTKSEKKEEVVTDAKELADNAKAETEQTKADDVKKD